MNQSLILGIDGQPRRLGLAVVDADTGAPIKCWTEPLDQSSGGWQWQQVARALLTVDQMGEVQAVGIEDSVQGAPSRHRNAVIGHARTQAWLIEHTIVRWPWLEAEAHTWVKWWSPAKPGAKTTDDNSMWRHWGGVGDPYDKDAVMQRALALNFSPKNQDEADAAVIAHATWRWSENDTEVNA